MKEKSVYDKVTNTIERLGRERERIGENMDKLDKIADSIAENGIHGISQEYVQCLRRYGIWIDSDPTIY